MQAAKISLLDLLSQKCQICKRKTLQLWAPNLSRSDEKISLNNTVGPISYYWKLCKLSKFFILPWQPFLLLALWVFYWNEVTLQISFTSFFFCQVNSCISQIISGVLVEQEDWHGVDRAEKDLYFLPENENVIFASALHGLLFKIHVTIIMFIVIVCAVVVIYNITKKHLS